MSCNLITSDGNLKLLNKTQQKGNTKYRAVNATDMWSWWALGLISEEQICFLHGDRARWVPSTSWSPSGWALGMLRTDGSNFFSVVHSEGQSQNSSPPACLLWCVLDKTSTNEIATQIQGCICRWVQQYFLLRLQSFYRHQPARVPKVFMKFIAWTIKKTWVWAEWLWMKNTGLLWGKESSPNTLIWETISA